MTSKQFADLEAVIERWMDEHCEEADWPHVVIGTRTVELMARAARSVFDACEESQEYAKREGFVTVAAR